MKPSKPKTANCRVCLRPVPVEDSTGVPYLYRHLNNMHLSCEGSGQSVTTATEPVGEQPALFAGDR